MDLDVDEPAAVRRGQWRGSGAEEDAAVGLAVLALTVGQHDTVVPVGRQPDDLEPAIRVGHEEERPVARPSATDVHASFAGDDAHRPVGDVDERDLGGLVDRRAEMSHDREPRPVGRPLEGVDVQSGRGQRRQVAAALARSPACRDEGPARR